ncbi:MAG: hypothetical protein WA140_06720 [Geobacteraceae bacterium]
MLCAYPKYIGMPLVTKLLLGNALAAGKLQLTETGRCQAGACRTVA